MTKKEKQIQTIKKLGPRVQKWILRAMEELLQNYQDGGYLRSCPLCEVGGYKKDCFRCPWIIFQGKECADFKREREVYRFTFIMNLRNRENPQWTRLRIRQLKRWIRVWKEAMDA